MAVLAKKRRYTIVGDFSLKDEHGLVHHLTGGDVLPEGLQALLSEDEIRVHLSTGVFRPVGWTPPAPQAEQPPTPPTALEVIQRFDPAATLEGDRIKTPGRTLAGVDFIAKKDLKRALDTGPRSPVVLHDVGGWPVATIDLGWLCQLLAGRNLMR